MSLKKLQNTILLGFANSSNTHVPSTQFTLGWGNNSQLLCQELHRLGQLTIICHNLKIKSVLKISLNYISKTVKNLNYCVFVRFIVTYMKFGSIAFFH